MWFKKEWKENAKNVKTGGTKLMKIVIKLLDLIEDENGFENEDIIRTIIKGNENIWVR